MQKEDENQDDMSDTDDEIDCDCAEVPCLDIDCICSYCHR
jgi:hypothetical protein